MDTADAQDDPTTRAAATGTPAEPHPDLPTIGPIAGRYCWDVATDQWWWSDEMYVIHGFAPRQVVPTTALFLSHKHPDDLPKAKNTIATALERGEHYCCYHRIYDAGNRERHVLTVGGARRDTDGRVVELYGFMIDLTQARRDDFQPAIEEAIQAAVEHRTEIDLAKGAIMLGYGVDADAAFAILRSASSENNIKLHDLASRVVHALADTAPDTTAAADRLDSILTEVAHGEADPTPA